MPNTFEYATWLSMECLDLLENKRAVSQFFNTDYNKELTKPFAVGDSFKIPFPQQFLVTNGLPYQPQAINRRSTTVTMDEPFHIGFEWDSAEELLRAPRGRDKVRREILEPAMSQMASEIDMRCAKYAAQYASTNTAASLDTNPSTFDTTSAISRQLMQELGCPATGERAMIVPPAVMRAIKTTSLGQQNPAVDISKQNRTGIIGVQDGFEWYESMNLYRHTIGTFGANGGTIATSAVDGATTLALTATTADTFKKGDKIRIALVYPVNNTTRQRFGSTTKDFTVTADAVVAASAVTISIEPPIYGPGSPYQNVDALPVAGQAVTAWTGTTTPSGHVGTIALALHRNAFALVSGELELPKGSSVELASQSRDPDSGVAIRFIRAFDPRASKMINRFDCIIGFGCLYSDACAVAIPCA